MRDAVLVLLILNSFNLFGTTIIPFENLGLLKINADLVVYVEGLGDIESQNSISTSFAHKFKVIQIIKGDLKSKELIINYRKQKIGEFYRIIAGDNEFRNGTRYLLFLSNNNGIYQTICMSYYVFTEEIIDKKPFFKPLFINDSNILTKGKVEKLSVYKRDNLIQELLKFKAGDIWNSNKTVASKKYQELFLKELKSLPSHCNQFTYGGYPFRWQNNENSSLPVYYESTNSECVNISTELSDAISHITSNYTGVNMNLGGTFSGYSTNCNNGNDPVDANSEYATFINSTYGTDQVVLIQFSDPCNDISPLSSCSGTLAVGGSWVTNGTHTYNSQTWANQIYGYVIVNEDAGNCLCGNIQGGNSISDYSILMAHELTHVLGFGHITSGTANMNPSCCSEITNLDIQCLNNNYLPIPEVLGCTNINAHNYDSAATVNNGSCLTCTDGFLNGDEIEIDCGGNLCTPCVEGCMDISAHNYNALAVIDDNTCLTCTDGFLNGDEVDVDCGGSLCPDCPCTDVGDIALKNLTLSINDTIISSGMLTLDTVMVLNPASVFWQSQQSILLNPEFSVELGSELILNVDDCAIPN